MLLYAYQKSQFGGVGWGIEEANEEEEQKMLPVSVAVAEKAKVILEQ